MKKMLRTAQTFAPSLLEAKASLRRAYRRHFKIPAEPTYWIFEKFPIEDGRCFMDVGANRGQTLDSFRLFRPSEPVLSFEPNPHLLRALEQRFANDRSTQLFGFGLGTGTGRFTLFVPRYNSYMFDGFASFDRQAALEGLGPDLIYHFTPSKLELLTLDCEIRRWDDVPSKPALVKLDVQGFEAEVIRSGLQTIAQYRPTFIIENNWIEAGGEHRDDHASVLAGLGYEIASYTRRSLMVGKEGELNSIFIPNERIDAVRAALT